MKAIPLKENIYWVGGIDWRLRNFHGYLTQRGSTYNAYLIIDEKVTLIDTVKHYLFDEMIQRIRSVIDPAKIDYIVCNHVEMDHSGSIPKIAQLVPNAVIIADPKGIEGLRAHYGSLNYKEVKTNDTLNLGKETLQFIQTPMVHWPDNMYSFGQTSKILFSNDSFGQHIASSQRFDNEYPFDILMHEAKKYYANIVLPYGNQVQTALKTAATIPIEMVAPSHGIIWRHHISDIVNAYTQWAHQDTEEKALIVYDTMWDSTRKIASTLTDSFEQSNIPVTQYCLQDTHISDIMTDVLTAKYICIGSPTLNNSILPSVGAFLTYFKGLKPQKRIATAFGSYGWGGQSTGIIHTELESLGFTMLDPIKVKYIPSESTRNEIKERFMNDLKRVNKQH